MLLSLGGQPPDLFRFHRQALERGKRFCVVAAQRLRRIPK